MPRRCRRLARASTAAGRRLVRSASCAAQATTPVTASSLARLAQAAGRAVSVQLVVPPERFKGAAAQAAADCRAAGVALSAFEARALDGADVIVDALLGTGLARPVSGDFRAAIDAMNAAAAPVLALDVPSGLDADSGWPNAVAVRATATVTFLGLKQGLFLGAAVGSLRRARVRGARATRGARRRSAGTARAARAGRSEARTAASSAQCPQGLMRPVVARRRRARHVRCDPPSGRGRTAGRGRARLCRDASR